MPGPLSPAPAHLNDQHATTYYNPPISPDGNELFLTTGGPLTPYGTTIDASGGHWDAGDNMKYVETESYAMALMQIGVRDFPGQMGAGAPTVTSRGGSYAPNFADEAAFGMDFLSRIELRRDRRKQLRRRMPRELERAVELEVREPADVVEVERVLVLGR